MDEIKENIRTFINKIIWRFRNKHNRTTVQGFFDINLVTVGKHTYGGIKVIQTGNDGVLEIGSFCSIAREVAFVMNNEHRTDTFSTYPFKVMIANPGVCETTGKGGITVEDDVWIGYRALILDGVHIGRGAVIAAGAVVTKDVPPYSIVGGCPAKVIKMRFSDHLINRLESIDLNLLSDDFIKENVNLLYETMDEEVMLKIEEELQKSLSR